MNGKPRLLISNVAVTCTEHDLSEWIERMGFTVDNVVLIRDAVSGTSPSFAHVYLHDPQLLNHAARFLDGRVLHGRRTEVSRIERRPSAMNPQREGRRNNLTRDL